MERTGRDSAEIVLYGDIVSKRPTDWDGNPIEGQYIILPEFMKDLKQVEDAAHLTVRIHSAGGNAYDAMTIHNRLKSMKADVEVVIDGVAMSGGSLIACAGNKVSVYPSSIIMIHRSWSFLFGGYNASELKKTIEENEAVDRAQAAIYHAKTGIPSEELLSMMEAETFLIGQEAVERGFADELLEGSGMKIAASANRQILFVERFPVWTSTRKGGIPEYIPTISSKEISPVTIHAPSPPSEEGKGGKEFMDTTNPTTQSPKLETPQVKIDAQVKVDPVDPVLAERKRLQEIDAIASLYSSDMVRAAKYETPCTAQELAYRAAQESVKQRGQFLQDLEVDTQASHVQEVPSVADPGETSPQEQTPEQRMAAARAHIHPLFKAKEGETHI